MITVFHALETKIQDPNISTNTLSNEFISTAFSIAKDLQITSMNDIIKTFHMFRKPKWNCIENLELRIL